LALPVRGYADSSRYSDYSESPAYGQSQSWREWWHNRPGHDEWSEERADQRRAWNRRDDDWSEYRREKQEAKEGARALLHHDD
jgi:hypothetical protein